MVLEDVARSWKKGEGKVIVNAEGDRLRGILKQLEGSMSGGRIIGGNGRGASMLSRETSGTGLLLENMVSGFQRPTTERNESQDSFRMSTLDVEEEEKTDKEGSREVRGWLKVINAFAQPKLVFNPTRKHFERSKTALTLLPPPDAKTELFRQRYHLIHQRLLRNESFQTLSILRQVSQLSQSWKVTSIANLLGRSGTGHLLLGLLAVAPTGTLAISDLTGTIQLDLEHATSIDDVETWLCPGMIVLVDGVYEEEYNSAGGSLAGAGGVGGTISGRFVGFSVGAPRCETRAQSLGLSDVNGNDPGAIGGGFGWVDFLGVGSERAVGSRMRRLEQRLLACESQPTVAGHSGKTVILGQVTLGNPKTLAAIRTILGAYAGAANIAAEADSSVSAASMLPTSFVFFGSFVAHAALSSPFGTAASHDQNTSSIAYKELFDTLAALLHDFPMLLRHCTFIFVPGDNDPWPSAFSSGAACPLPRARIPEMFTGRIKREIATANADSAARSRETRGHHESIHGEAIWTSNPSRVSLFGPQQEMVLFRDDASGRLRRNAVPLRKREVGNVGVDCDGVSSIALSEALPVERLEQHDGMDVDATEAATAQLQEQNQQAVQTEASIQHARRLTKTLLDQTHLCPYPLSIRPVHWSHAHTLSLYPLPSALVLCDAEAEAFSVVYQGCCVVNAGRLVGPAGNGSARERAKWVEYDFRTRRGAIRETAI